MQAPEGFGCKEVVKVCHLSVVWWNLIRILHLVQAAVMIFLYCQMLADIYGRQINLKGLSFWGAQDLVITAS